MTKKIMLASNNPGKVREIRQILASNDAEIVTPAEAGISLDVEETGTTYLENALIKARRLAELTGSPAIADDSGIEVDALDGRPGVHSARFAGMDASDEENNRKLISELESSDQRSARYRCVAVMVMPDGSFFSAEGVCEGEITREPRGGGGFGYDPWFVPEGQTRTMAELSSEEKDAISHRGKAFRTLQDKISASV